MELPVIATSDTRDPAALSRAARSADRAIAEVLGKIISTDAAECVVDPARPTVTHLNAALQLVTQGPDSPDDLLAEIQKTFAEHRFVARWIVPATDDVPDHWKTALAAAGYRPAVTTVFAMVSVPLAPTRESPVGPAQCLPARSIVPVYLGFLEKVIHITRNSSQEFISAAVGLLDVDGIDILTWRLDGDIVADAVIQTVADIGFIREIRVVETARSTGLDRQIIDGVVAWCNRCQFRNVIAALRTPGTIPEAMIGPLGLRQTASYTTWYLNP